VVAQTVALGARLGAADHVLVVISGVRACFSATLLAGYCRGVLAPVVRDESPVMALQRPGVRP